MGEDVEKLKQRQPLLDYLRQQNWDASPAGHGSSEFVGLCPLRRETQPSFYVNARKNLFCCHGCGQGGDLIRFVQLSRHLSFRQSLAYLEQQSAPPVDSAAVLEEAAAFYQEQLDSYPEALRYLKQRGVRDPALIQELRIGYAPGGSLRRHLTLHGNSFDLLRRVGLLNSQGRDTFYGRVVFPCCQDGRLVNLYGRSLGAAFTHRFLPGPKGGLYAWEQVRQCPAVILVEGLFDYAVLWQAGFRHVTCSLGIHLNAYAGLIRKLHLSNGSKSAVLASSTFAIAGMLEGLAAKLKQAATEQTEVTQLPPELPENLETFDELAEEWEETEDEDAPENGVPKKVFSPEQLVELKQEMESLRTFADIARSILKNSKGAAQYILIILSISNCSRTV